MTEHFWSAGDAGLRFCRLCGHEERRDRPTTAPETCKPSAVVADLVREMKDAYSDLREVSVGAILLHIAPWSVVEVEYALRSATKTAEFRRRGEFNTEACPSHVLELRRRLARQEPHRVGDVWERDGAEPAPVETVTTTRTVAGAETLLALRRPGAIGLAAHGTPDSLTERGWRRVRCAGQAGAHPPAEQEWGTSPEAAAHLMGAVMKLAILGGAEVLPSAGEVVPFARNLYLKLDAEMLSSTARDVLDGIVKARADKRGCVCSPRATRRRSTVETLCNICLGYV